MYVKLRGPLEKYLPVFLEEEVLDVYILNSHLHKIGYDRSVFNVLEVIKKEKTSEKIEYLFPLIKAGTFTYSDMPDTMKLWRTYKDKFINLSFFILDGGFEAFKLNDFPSQMTHLTIGRGIEFKLPALPNLVYLSINPQSYNLPLPELPKLRYLKLEKSDHFNQPLKIYPKLYYLSLGRLYNQPLPNFPRLEKLILGYMYNQPLPDLPRLIYLKLNDKYEKPLPVSFKNITVVKYPGPKLKSNLPEEESEGESD